MKYNMYTQETEVQTSLVGFYENCSTYSTLCVC